MSREEFIDNLRLASRLLAEPRAQRDHGARTDANVALMLNAADLWLTHKTVAGFSPADFADLPRPERQDLATAVESFLAIAKRVSADKPATKSDSRQARGYLKRAIKIVRDQVMHDWLEAQREMLATATAAAEARGWYVDMDEKEVQESLLGSYQAPRLRIRTPDREFVLDPVVCFGSGRQGIVDLVVLPTYETERLIALKDRKWWIVSRHGAARAQPFTPETFATTIAKLSRP